MPISKAEADGGLGCVFTVEGLLEDAEYFACLHEHLTTEFERFAGYRYTLFDMSEMGEIAVETESIRKVAALAEASAERNRDSVVAFVTPSQLAFGLYRLFDLSMGEHAWENRSFDKREDPERWLRERIAAKFGIEDPLDFR